MADHDGLDVPKVIDFGIAKAIESQTFGETVFTSHDQFFGTPAYMSPEQIDLAGLDVDTRSDIYSLGVLLYELLTSRTPLDGELLATQGISKIRDTLLNTEVQRPSLMLGEVEKAALQTVASDRKSRAGAIDQLHPRGSRLDRVEGDGQEPRPSLSDSQQPCSRCAAVSGAPARFSPSSGPPLSARENSSAATALPWVPGFPLRSRFWRVW